MSNPNPYITINFFPAGARQTVAKPITAKLHVTDAAREASLKLGFFTKDIGAGEHIAVVCHSKMVAKALAESLRQAANELEAFAALTK